MLYDNWGPTPIRVTDLAITPDLTRLVTVGMYYHPSLPPSGDSPQPNRNNSDSASLGSGGNGLLVNGSKGSDTRMIVYDLLTKQTESCVQIYSICCSTAIPSDVGFFLT
jgi:WD repeat-containing protein 26